MHCSTRKMRQHSMASLRWMIMEVVTVMKKACLIWHRVILKSIIRDIDTDPDKQQIVENIVAYAHKRDMKIVAEGLETPEEINKVLELGVDLLQGFYIAKPHPIPTGINPLALKTISQFYT